MTWKIVEGDCVESMRAMDANSVDAIVCDPPYLLTFMGRSWDHAPTPAEGQAMHLRWAREALRVLKPGGHLFAFGGARTYHRLVCAIEDAGFEIRDTIAWLYGSGFPKSLDVSKAIDAAAGATRETVGEKLSPDGVPYSALHGERSGRTGGGIMGEPCAVPRSSELLTAPATADAERWQGWGTALKPAHEPIVVARKPLAGTVAANVLAHGTGALNVDGCRIAGDVPSVPQPDFGSVNGRATHLDANARNGEMSHAAGRWPANVVLDSEAAATLDEQTGESVGGNSVGPRPISYSHDTVYEGGVAKDRTPFDYGDSGGASRFFYVAKASSAERNAGLDGFEANRVNRYSPKGQGPLPQQTPTVGTIERNVHPTVKPVALMRWLVRLVTPPGGLVLDPFAGSGTTGAAAMLEGFRFVGIEREPEYAAIARARIAWWAKHPDGMELVERLEHEKQRKAKADAGQLGLFGA